MEANTRKEYLDNDYNTVYTNECSYVPQLGSVICIDNVCYKVLNIESFLYTKNCKENKIRVYLEIVPDS